MNMLETMKMALEALEMPIQAHKFGQRQTAITNLTAAIKAMEDAKPVAWIGSCSDGERDLAWESFDLLHCDKKVPLYTAPAVPEDVAKDAARYRYLKKEIEDRDGWLAVSNWDTVQWESYRTGDDLDNAIDAAMNT